MYKLTLKLLLFVSSHNPIVSEKCIQYKQHYLERILLQETTDKKVQRYLQYDVEKSVWLVQAPAFSNDVVHGLPGKPLTVEQSSTSESCLEVSAPVSHHCAGI